MMPTSKIVKIHLLLTGYQPYGNLMSVQIIRECFQTEAMSVLLFGCITWTLKKHLGKMGTIKECYMLF